jgi:hypothetical protein
MAGLDQWRRLGPGRVRQPCPRKPTSVTSSQSSLQCQERKFDRVPTERTAEGACFRDLLDQFVAGLLHLLFASAR